MREWNAAVYHRVSDPQLDWGLPVLARLPLTGDELVLDVGCGTGRLTERLLERLPRGRVVAIDQSSNMIAAARDHLRKASHSRVAFAQCEASFLPFADCVDAIFSTATFHWIRDHDRLFASLWQALKPGGRLVAQCGGAANLDRIHARIKLLMREPEYDAQFGGWRDPWEFADEATTAARLHTAGFVDVQVRLEPAPVMLSDAGAFREFVEHVICRPFLARIHDAAGRDRFMTVLTEWAAGQSPSFELDYWRLNLDARRPV